MRVSRNRLVGIAAIGVISGATALGVVAGSSGPAGAAAGAPADPTSAQAVEPALAEQFSLLRRAAVVLPELARTQLRDAPIHARYGANLALARATEMAVGGTAIVVPGDDAVCLWVPVDAGYGGTCVSAADARVGKLSLQLVAGKRSTVVALVPDGFDAPVVRTVGEDSIVLPVRDNIAAGIVDDAATLTVGATVAPLR